MKNFLSLGENSFLVGKLGSSGNERSGNFILKLFLITFVLILNANVGNALPSYARQTGMSCSACHYSFPELNPFGRQFKINGYVMTGVQTIESKDDSSQITRLKLLSTLPLSVMIQSSFPLKLMVTFI